MNAVGMLGSYISRGVYTVSGPFHPFGGCVDIIVVEQQDGTFKSSPWYVRFGKFQGVLKTREKVVNICVNGSEADFHMYLDHKGEAYFLREVEEGEEGPVLSNNSLSGDEEPERPPPLRSQSCNFDEAENGKVVVARTGSRRARILGLVFGRRSSRKENEFGDGSEEIMRRADSLERAEFAANLLDVKWSTNIDTKKPVVKGNGWAGQGDQELRVDENGDDLQVPAVLQICPRKESDDEEEVPEGNVGKDKVQSFIYCESSESSVVNGDCSSEQTHETMCITSGEAGELRVQSEVLRARTEPLSEDTVVEHVLEDYKLEVPLVEGLGYCLKKTGSSRDMVTGETLLELGTCPESNNGSPVLGSGGDEVESQDVYPISSFDNSFLQSEDNENTKVEQILLSESPNIETKRPLSVDFEEEQLLFGDIDEFNDGEIRTTESSLPVSEDTEKFPEGIEDLNESTDKSDQSQSSPERSSHENQSPDIWVSSSPIAINGAHKVVDEQVGRLGESLPNLWSKIDSFGADDVNCLSHSLDSNSKILDWTLQIKDDPSSMKFDGDEEKKLISEHSDTNGSVETTKVEDLPSTTAIEVSLCKHLFYEGMGSDAASGAFNAEKLDVEKFLSLGPELMKDDRLVVRINGSYFPWDAAAPMVLGMVSFGTTHMVDPKGKIDVDQVEKTVSGDSLNGNMSPGGNWKLWPFSFRRSRSRNAVVQSSLSDVGNSDPEIVSEVNVQTVEDKNTAEPKIVKKKMVPALSPTSEQLASLNLKEGRNAVTFTFLTPMLGKQQVDCRIYLWKWNTRIVISDVDGTITRSDVLGQFMPLVGVDWSHLGVAHLFSAIKENGYQMLFLSARAISQAYITRQFLLNLKQDGKALPDGPVVISPDGLFPSLYREVIRRAPHEFKIACLEEIRSLFPPDCNPFYAGFGNRDTDEVSYLKVGIPKGKIFIINPKGEVVVNRRVDTKSYKSIHSLVNGMFPPTASSEQEDFNDLNFWKLPPPIID